MDRYHNRYHRNVRLLKQSMFFARFSYVTNLQLGLRQLGHVGHVGHETARPSQLLSPLGHAHTFDVQSSFVEVEGEVSLVVLSKALEESMQHTSTTKSRVKTSAMQRTRKEGPL